MLRAELGVLREQYLRLEVKVAELERRLGPGSTNSGIPPSKDPIGARERRKAGRARERQSSERERRKDRKRGGQPGHPGAGLPRDPEPDERAEVPPSAECSRCRCRAGGSPASGHLVVTGPGREDHDVCHRIIPAAAATCRCCGKVSRRRRRRGRIRAACRTDPGSIWRCCCRRTGTCRPSGPRTRSGCCWACRSPRGSSTALASGYLPSWKTPGFDAAMQAVRYPGASWCARTGRFAGPGKFRWTIGLVLGCGTAG